MSAFERLKDWSERFAATDAIAAEVKQLADEHATLQRTRSTAYHLWQEIDQAQDAGFKLPFRVTVAAEHLRDALEAAK